MPGLSSFEQFIQSYLSTLLANSLDIKTFLQQMSFGLINVAPPPGEPSLTSQLNNIVFQIQSLRDHLDTANTEMISQNVDILAAIAALPDGSGPVVLPTTPPTGYGGTTGISASDVWNELVAGGTQSAGDLLADAGWLGINLSTAGVRLGIPNSKWFDIYGTWWSPAGPPTPSSGPIFPVASILPDDTLSTFLERESYYTSWIALGDETYSVASGEGDFQFVTKITAAEFLILRDGPAAAGDLTGLIPPVWPGIANVTLSTPAAISTGLTITEPMDGVIVNITGVPTRSNFFQFDDKPSYRNLGALVFFNDDGELEAPQLLGFEDEVYSPKSMSQAAGVKLRTEGGVSGTVTPWVKTVV